ncbi:MAG: hydantoinase/oxoprolinase family protein [Pseudomonadota bacterium]
MERNAPGVEPVLLGLDTGGTYTDAVLISEPRMQDGPSALIAKAKALTTRDDLSLGIAEAVDAVLAEAGVAPAEIALVSLSTTLATNALVERQGGRAGLVMIGFAPADLDRQGLAEARGDDPLIPISGGHDPMGAEQAPLDLAALRQALETLPSDIGAFAVCSHFAVRNPAHEREAAAEIARTTVLPVTCSHDLTAEIGGPKRGLTALLNARLIAMIARLIESAERLLQARGIAAPLMVVRGDGALVSAGFARQRPVETILSGPAASLVGAGWLTGRQAAVVSDIGGTTTDVAVLCDGRPRLDPAGAEVGGLRTMVEAVAMRTHGLGGDSTLGLIETGPEAGLHIGPTRVIPISLLARDHPQAVHAMLDRQLAATRSGARDGRCLILRGATVKPHGDLRDRIGPGPSATDVVLTGRAEQREARRLIARGLVAEAAFCPSDAAHVLGLQSGWDRDAAVKAATLFARQKGRDGQAIAKDAEAISRQVIALLTRRSAERVLETALVEDGFAGVTPAAPMLQAALDGHAGILAPRLGFSLPLIGLGASAASYYPGVARLLDAEVDIPAHADVANAIGAVVGHVRLTRRATVSVPAEGLYRAHLPDGPRDFTESDAAESAAEAALRHALIEAVAAAGAESPDITRRIDRKLAEIEGKESLIETEITLTATGRPRLAAEAVDRPADLPAGFSGL